MMEMMQTIWTALTTENEVLLNIISFPLFFVDAFVCMLLFTTILNIKTTKTQKIIYVIVLGISCFLARLIPNPYGAILNMIILPLCVIFILKSTILKGIISEIICFSIGVILELIIGKAVLIIFNSTLTVSLNTPLSRIATTSVIYLCIYLLYRFIKRFQFSTSFLENLDKRSKKLLISDLILAIFVIASQLFLVFYYSDTFSLIMSVINAIILLAYFVISVLSFFSIAELSITTRNLEEEQLSKKTLQLLYDNISAFKHDFNNIVQGIDGYIQTNDMEGLKKFHSQLLADCQHVNNLNTLSPEIINNPAVYNLLATKYHKADNLGIKINLDVTLDLEQLHMKVYEFTRILGILMDNAIEATSECDEKIINVGIKESDKQNMQVLIIENTFIDKQISNDEMFKKGFSTKPGNTGLGLWEVNKILKRNNNISLFTTKNKQFFRQQLEIFY